MKLLLVRLLFSLCLVAASAGPWAPGNTCGQLELDGVQLRACLPFASGPWLAPPPELKLQVASTQADAHASKVSLTAIPVGTRAGSEIFPVIAAGQVERYRELLRAFRAQQAETLAPAPPVTLFGQSVPGWASVVRLNDLSGVPQPVQILEWLAEAGGRVWVLRIGRALRADAPELILSGLSLAAEDLAVPSPSLAALQMPPEPALPEPPLADPLADLPTPSWWSGDCDTTHYYAQTGRIAYPLGGSYRGMKACGPRPYADNGADALIYFYSGAWGVYEWECTELSLRYLYLAYGTPPYPGNGADIVRNYPGSRLVRVSNPTVGRAPQAGDVLSYNQYAPWGHTSVVTASNVDAGGNGTITILEENGAANGTRTHTVSNWKVNDSQDIYGWLHDPCSDDFGAPTTTAQLSGSPGEGGWYPAPLTVTLTAVDAPGGWGVKSSDYRIDGEPNYHVYTGPIAITADGAHTVAFRSVDYANNWELEKSISFKFDGTPPQGGAVIINGGAVVTHATLVSLAAPVTDALSGPAAVRLRDSGGTWSAWQALKPRYGWLLPAQTGQNLGIEVQFKDRAGNLSLISTASIGLNIYPFRPVSPSHRLLRTTIGAGAGQASSSAYNLRGTIAQPSPTGAMQSSQYRIQSGYGSPYRRMEQLNFLPVIRR